MTEKTTDTRSKEQRSRIMRSVKTAHTGPEMVVRRLLHGMGYRYRLHAKELAGKPDIVLRPRKKAIFVHGCFWHGHNCKIGHLPKSNEAYWALKIERNKERDQINTSLLINNGWDVLTVWQCELRDASKLAKILMSFLEKTKSVDRQITVNRLASRD